ncbi:MAG: ABC transporter ATP-binding protein [Marinobacter sp.]|nr:ABC transporter ATP-binding protein [Marinobacter sp.]
MTIVTNATPGNLSQPLALLTHGLSFRWSEHETPIKFPDIQLPAGEHLFLQGASGSGKSTLLGLLAGMSRPTGGQLSVLGTELASLSRRKRDRFRADHQGVIFQQFNLVPYLSALDNVLLPCRLSSHRARRATPTPLQQAETLLQALDVPGSHWRKSVNHLSVGQQQRVAAARALIGSPPLILADEPTSALDADNRDRFIELLLAQCQHSETSVIFVSHDRSLASHFHHHISLTSRQEEAA